jgi:acyl phosphate:glycerol-3-phosphate acyltransferase
MITEFLNLLIAYLIGSIPFGIIFSLCAGYGDIRKIGSGNIGATNVLRTGNKFIAAITLIADSSKIIIAILVTNKFGFTSDYLSGSMALLGHLFPIWLKFKGGKGVASFLGFGLYLFPKIALLMLITWIVTFSVSRYSSLAALTAAFAAIMALYITMPIGMNLGISIGIILLIIYKHKDNIHRLLKGKELKFNSK